MVIILPPSKNDHWCNFKFEVRIRSVVEYLEQEGLPRFEPVLTKQWRFRPKNLEHPG